MTNFCIIQSVSGSNMCINTAAIKLIANEPDKSPLLSILGQTTAIKAQSGYQSAPMFLNSLTSYSDALAAIDSAQTSSESSIELTGFLSTFQQQTPVYTPFTFWINVNLISYFTSTFIQTENYTINTMIFCTDGAQYMTTQTTDEIWALLGLS